MEVRGSEILSHKRQNPPATAREISVALGVPVSTVRTVMRSSAGKVLAEELATDSLQLLADVRRKALNRVSELLSGKPGSLTVKDEIALLRLVLKPVLNAGEQSQELPKLIFETTITPRGTIQRTELTSDLVPAETTCDF
jgi:hypothetical protein